VDNLYEVFSALFLCPLPVLQRYFLLLLQLIPWLLWDQFFIAFELAAVFVLIAAAAHSFAFPEDLLFCSFLQTYKKKVP
jgi:hypothetical protein